LRKCDGLHQRECCPAPCAARHEGLRERSVSSTHCFPSPFPLLPLAGFAVGRRCSTSGSAYASGRTRPPAQPATTACDHQSGQGPGPVQRGRRRPAVIGPASGCRFRPPEQQLSVRPVVAGPACGCRFWPAVVGPPRQLLAFQ
jgi:hypothetical protein